MPLNKAGDCPKCKRAGREQNPDMCSDCGEGYCPHCDGGCSTPSCSDEETDGNQAITQSSGDNRSAAQKSSSPLDDHGIRERIIQAAETPALETTRQAIIDALVKHRVIGAREAVDRLVTAAARAALLAVREEMEWQPIETHQGYSPVLVGRPSDKLSYQATSAFMDVTGVWRVFRSEAGMTPLPFKPTHWMPLPAAPGSPSILDTLLASLEPQERNVQGTACPDCVKGLQPSTYLDDEQPMRLCSTCDGGGLVDPHDDEPFRVEVGKGGCERCGHGTQWTVVGPNDVAIGQSFEDQELAEDIAEYMNQGYRAGCGGE